MCSLWACIWRNQTKNGLDYWRLLIITSFYCEFPLHSLGQHGPTERMVEKKRDAKEQYDETSLSRHVLYNTSHKCMNHITRPSERARTLFVLLTKNPSAFRWWFRLDFAVYSHCLSALFCLFCRCMLNNEVSARASAHRSLKIKWNEMKWIQLTLTFVRHDVKRRICFFLSLCIYIHTQHICGFWFSPFSIHFFIYLSLKLHSVDCIAAIWLISYIHTFKRCVSEWEWRMNDELNAILLTHFVCESFILWDSFLFLSLFHCEIRNFKCWFFFSDLKTKDKNAVSIEWTNKSLIWHKILNRSFKTNSFELFYSFRLSLKEKLFFLLSLWIFPAQSMLWTMV